MRQSTIILAILVAVASAGSPSRAADDLRQAVIAAAIDSAAQGLLDKIEPQFVAPNITVRQFLDQTHGHEELRSDLARSDPVGGPRWLDEHTCQIRLQVSGTEVVADLANIASHHAAQTPIPAMRIPAVAGALGSQWFTATGAGTSSAVAPVPPPGSAWANVPAMVRSRAIADANADAVRKVLVSIKSVELTPGHPLAEALSIPSIEHSLSEWIAGRPVTSVEYRQSGPDQLDVQVTLSAEGRDLFDTLKTAVIAQGGLPIPRDPTAWAAVRDQVVLQMAQPIGEASATTQPAVAAAVQLPSAPPDWTDKLADAIGIGGPSPRPLLANNAAKADAMSKLRQKVYELNLTPGHTIGQAMQADPHFATTVQRAIDTGAHPYKSIYNPDGTVEVRVSLDLQYLWTAITDRP